MLVGLIFGLLLNKVLDWNIGDNRNYDVKYSIDNLNRVTKADEGSFSTGSISNRSREEEWSLDQVGNWARAKLDLNGDLVYAGGGELDDTITHNEANELLTRDTSPSASTSCFSPGFSPIVKACCVCDVSLKREFPDATTNKEITSCVEQHEQRHRDEQSWCINDRTMARCCEIMPTIGEIVCLQPALDTNKCSASPNPQKCRGQIKKRKQGLQEYLFDAFAACISPPSPR